MEAVPVVGWLQVSARVYLGIRPPPSLSRDRSGLRLLHGAPT
jgi:hypothetical protein